MNSKKQLNYSIESHVNNATDKVKDLFILLHPQILSLKDVESYARSNYIGYKLIVGKHPFVEMHFRKKTNRIELHLRPIKYSTPNLNIYQVPDGHLWKLNTIVDVYDKDQIDIVFDLVRKSYEQIL